MPYPCFVLLLLLQVLSVVKEDLCEADQPELSIVVFHMNLSVDDVLTLRKAIVDWDFSFLARHLLNKATKINTTEFRVLYTIDKHLPSSSFLRAVEGLSADQIGHLMQLHVDQRHMEIKHFLGGFVLSIPDEHQNTTNAFLRLLSHLYCLGNQSLNPVYHEIEIF